MRCRATRAALVAFVSRQNLIGLAIMNSARATVPADVMLRLHLYSDINDRMKHYREMQAIADDLQRPIMEIAPLYEDVLEYLRENAHVTDFLPILVSKRVRELCRRTN